MKCERCGNDLPPGRSFCTGCGFKIVSCGGEPSGVPGTASQKSPSGSQLAGKQSIPTKNNNVENPAKPDGTQEPNPQTIKFSDDRYADYISDDEDYSSIDFEPDETTVILNSPQSTHLQTPKQSSSMSLTQSQSPSSSPVSSSSPFSPPSPPAWKPLLQPPGFNQTTAVAPAGSIDITAATPKRRGLSAEPTEGYVLYEKQDEQDSPFLNPATIFTMVLIFIVMAGYPLIKYVAAGAGGVGINSPVEDSNDKIRISYPSDWKMYRDPADRTGHANAIGYYFKGTSRDALITNIIYLSNGQVAAPQYFSDDWLDHVEPRLINMNQEYLKLLGMNYEFLKYSTYMIDGREALWMEGNGTRKNKAPIRDFTFIAFNENRIYTIKFLFEDKYVEIYWPEIEGILKSIDLL